MEKPPLISLILVVKNGAATIDKALASVRAQTFRDFEFLVMDAASTDGTAAIVRNYSDCVTFFRSAPDKGSYDAFNQALDLARGSIIASLMADDWLLPDAFATVAELHQRTPKAGVYSFGLQEYEADVEGSFHARRYFCDSINARFTLQDGMYCQGLGRFYSAELLQRVGHYNFERYPKIADREWYMRIGLEEPQKARTEQPLYAFRHHAGSVSANPTPASTLQSLEQMRRIARDYLALPGVSPRQRDALKDWYCFVMVRLLAYRLQCRDIPQFLLGTLEALFAQPLRMPRWLIHYHMPAPYRAQPPR